MPQDTAAAGPRAFGGEGPQQSPGDLFRRSAAADAEAGQPDGAHPERRDGEPAEEPAQHGVAARRQTVLCAGGRHWGRADSASTYHGHAAAARLKAGDRQDATAGSGMTSRLDGHAGSAADLASLPGEIAVEPGLAARATERRVTAIDPLQSGRSFPATTGFVASSADAVLGSVRSRATVRVPLTAGNLTRHLERLSAGSRAAALAAANADAENSPPKGFADLPPSIEALILHDAFRASGCTLRAWLSLSLVNKCGSFPQMETTKRNASFACLHAHRCLTTFFWPRRLP